MKSTFIIIMADLAFILFLNAPSQEAGVPVGLRMEHRASHNGLLEPVRVERAYVRFVASNPGAFRSELRFAGQVVALGAQSGDATLAGAAQALAGVNPALSSLGAPPEVAVVFQLVLPDDMPLREAMRLHARAKELGLDCEVVSNSEGTGR